MERRSSIRDVALSRRFSSTDEVARAYLHWVRVLASTITGSVFIVAGIAGDEAAIVRVGLIGLFSGLVIGALYILFARRAELGPALRLSVYGDTAIIAFGTAQLPDVHGYTVAYLYGIVVAAMLCTPRVALSVTLLSTALATAIPIVRGSDDLAVIVVNSALLLTVGIVISWLRVGELRRAEERAHLERLLRQAQELAHVGSWEWDGETDTATWSDEMFSIFGLDRGVDEPLSLVAFMDVIAEEDRDRIREDMASSMAVGRPVVFDTSIRRPDGELRAVHAIGNSVGDPDGSIRVLGSVQDVTELRRLDAMREEFVAAASHELRTPTSIIAGFASTLRESWAVFGDADRYRYVGEIDDAAQRLSLLIEDVLQVSQIESGKLRCERRPFDIAQEVTELVRSWPGKVPVELDLDDAESVVAIGDAIRTGQVLTNLLANAERHTPDGAGIAVRVLAAGDRVDVSVSDTGPGIDYEDQERIFDRFVRLDRTQPGTGLGLYISRRLAEAQDGRLVVDSDPGHGATFTLSLRAATGRVDA